VAIGDRDPAEVGAGSSMAALVPHYLEAAMASPSGLRWLVNAYIGSRHQISELTVNRYRFCATSNNE